MGTLKVKEKNIYWFSFSDIIERTAS